MAALEATAEEAGRRSRRHRAWDTVAAAADTPARVAAAAGAGASSRAAAVSSPEPAVAAEEQGETEAVVVSLIGALVGAEVARGS